MTFRFTLAYDGTDFTGWQRQPNFRTVQGELEATFAKVMQKPVICKASGRTDSGVHALGQVVAFDADVRMELPALAKALNAELPEDMQIFEIEPVRDGFDPIRDAVSKRYRYVVEDGRVRDVFDRHYVWQIYRDLDEKGMQQAATALVGTHDFVSYQTSGSMRLTTVRTVYDITVERVFHGRTPRVIIEVEANGFLYNMVRNFVGTLVAVGLGKQAIHWPAEVLAQKDRKLAGMTAPPQGLFLVQVVYDDEAHDNPDAEEASLPPKTVRPSSPAAMNPGSALARCTERPV